MKTLLDVNVLIALLDASHIHHGLTATWLANHVDEGWASFLSNNTKWLYPYFVPAKLSQFYSSCTSSWSSYGG